MQEEPEEPEAPLRCCFSQKKPGPRRRLALRRWPTVTAAASWGLTIIWLWFEVETPSGV